MAKSKEVIEEVIEEVKELTPVEFNNNIWAEIKELEDKIQGMKEQLKPVELVKNASLAECNRIAAKNSQAIIDLRKLNQPKRK